MISGKKNYGKVSIGIVGTNCRNENFVLRYLLVWIIWNYPMVLVRFEETV